MNDLIKKNMFSYIYSSTGIRRNAPKYGKKKEEIEIKHFFLFDTVDDLEYFKENKLKKYSF